MLRRHAEPELRLLRRCSSKAAGAASRSASAFVDKATGSIFKPDG
jgi:hypothetical protein